MSAKLIIQIRSENTALCLLDKKKVNFVNHKASINWKRLKLFAPRLCSSGDPIKSKQLDAGVSNTIVFHRLARQKIQRLHFERPTFYVPNHMHKLL